MMRAVIDIGSNSILLLVGERDETGRLRVVRDVAVVARLSQGAAERGSLASEAIARALAVLEQHVEQARADGVVDIVAVATEGLRMVDNPEDFLEPAAAILGAPVRLISGDEEARLSYLSVAQESVGQDSLVRQPVVQRSAVQGSLLPEQADEGELGSGEPARELRVLDIGGASTELVVGRGTRVLGAMSHRIGSVRLSEQFIAGRHPPSPEVIEAMAEAARQALARQPLPPLPELHGLAGTVTTIAALLLGLERYDRERVDGRRFTIEQVRSLRDELATWSLARLQAEPMLGKGRADLIVSGATILLVALEHCAAQTLVVRDRGLRYALL